ncbi:hypothetical protein [Bacillus bingmayongensis]|uniref:hypothetical protein n=1 Tax=Bacillus bingmayongensis TaxID=1150157 RepID=UPI001ED9992B|nr:hypothetical protein [Bacillus bingmayongensis]
MVKNDPHITCGSLWNRLGGRVQVRGKKLLNYWRRLVEQTGFVLRFIESHIREEYLHDKLW